MEKVTFVLVDALFSPPFQLLAIIVQALQAHDAVVHADPAKGQAGSQKLSSLTALIKRLVFIRFGDVVLKPTCGNCPPSSAVLAAPSWSGGPAFGHPPGTP